jgi:hypothetical protein
MSNYNISSEVAGAYGIAAGTNKYSVDTTPVLTRAQFLDEMANIITDMVTGNDSTFDGAGNWVTSLGSLAADIDTYPGELYLDFTSGNQSVKIANGLVSLSSFLISIKARKVSGAGMRLRSAKFGSSPSPDSFDFTPVETAQWFYGFVYDTAEGITDFNIGSVSADNNGTKIAIDEIKIQQVTIADIMSINYFDYLPTEYNINSLITNLSRAAQPLLNFAIMGDSIFANSYGGSIPVDEGDTMRPPRLTFNNMARRIYDKLVYNAPKFRRLDHADFTRSTLSGGDDFGEETDNTYCPWRPCGTYEKYFYTLEPSAYCEITIPDGYENFFIMYATREAYGTDMDPAIAVTLNGGDISAYGSAVLDTYRKTLTGEHVRGFGSMTAEYNNLPAGDNVIRLTKSNDTTAFMLWGIGYWSGDSVLISNLSYGGSATDQHAYYIPQYFNQVAYDLCIYQMPNMNNCSHGLDERDHAKALFSILSEPNFTRDNALFVTTYPMGTDPRDDDPNYYAIYNDPTQQEHTELCIKILCYLGFSYIDAYKYFRLDILSRGDTVENGGGGYYTSDGQHPSESGADLFDTYFTDKLSQIPE